ncbi:beta-N-acetylhexosaminidase [Sporobacter termitidis DSM 10068]|uniref:beta-N-acetylhexosaminidase n=1 Tax=Sporobacter termitidis DSM 10068 TaxID=1123282 RepID=A0A1M5XJX5_9FIRM|nr:glycoside hydrolase family 3 N-terminal domain-containing protein [Sporobacter termitidis]SHH99553.1 beta-N-acetylhexosaminidase [Sporobacter termitidis DSM 10068]
MKKGFYAFRVPALVLAALLLLSLPAGCGARRADETPGASATGASTAQSPAVSLSPSPEPPPSPSSSEAVSAIPAGWRDHGIFEDFYDAAYVMLQSMTLEEKIGQMLLVRCPQEDAAGFIKSYQPGGLVLYEADFQGKTADGVVKMIGDYQKAAKIPMMISTDEEGGTVVRISGNKNLAAHKFTSPQAVYKSGGMAAIRADAQKKAALLKSLGLNMNLAPVADISTNPKDYIYARTFGQAAPATGDYVQAVVAATRDTGLSSALKHFPGYGGNVNTHTGAAVDDRPLSEFYDSDFIPFESGIAAGAESVLVSHNIVNCMDKGVPASLSPAVHNILRTTLSFTGIIMTDDLSMDAVKDDAGAGDPVVTAALAGNDMLLLQDYKSAFQSLLSAAQAGTLPAETVDHAAFRVLAWKLARGIIQ